MQKRNDSERKDEQIVGDFLKDLASNVVKSATLSLKSVFLTVLPFFHCLSAWSFTSVGTFNLHQHYSPEFNYGKHQDQGSR